MAEMSRDDVIKFLRDPEMMAIARRLPVHLGDISFSDLISWVLKVKDDEDKAARMFTFRRATLPRKRLMDSPLMNDVPAEPVRVTRFGI